MLWCFLFGFGFLIFLGFVFRFGCWCLFQFCKKKEKNTVYILLVRQEVEQRTPPKHSYNICVYKSVCTLLYDTRRGRGEDLPPKKSYIYMCIHTPMTFMTYRSFIYVYIIAQNKECLWPIKFEFKSNLYQGYIEVTSTLYY